MIFPSPILNSLFPHTLLSYETHLINQFNLTYNAHMNILGVNDPTFSLAIWHKHICQEISITSKSIKDKITFIHKDTQHDIIEKEFIKTLVNILATVTKKLVAFINQLIDNDIPTPEKIEEIKKTFIESVLKKLS